MPKEPVTLADPNIDRFRDAKMVADYENIIGPRDCEEFLFATFVSPGKDVLDLGVGAGRTSVLLAPTARNYIGVDYSAEMIAAAKNSFPQYRFAVMDAADLSAFADDSFDVIVFSFNGLSYLHPDRKRLMCINECRRLLRHNGIFIFSLHNPHSILVRPKRASRTFVDTSRALLATVRQNIGRLYKRIMTRAFWFGHGYITTESNGELVTFAASKAFVRRELEKNGFAIVAEYVEAHPHRMSRFLTRWYYYVFQKSDRARPRPETLASQL